MNKAASLRVALAALICGGAFAHIAFGEEAPLDQKAAFNAFILLPSYQNFIQGVVSDGENAILKAQCSTLKVLRSDQYDIVDPPVFERRPDGNRLLSGAWVSVAVVDRCGQTATRRVLIKFVPGEKRFVETMLLPGDFHGNLKLEIDADRIVIPGLMADANCADRKQVFILDIRSLGPPDKGSWSEIWTAQACGNVVRQRVNYTPSENKILIEALRYSAP
jgi:hypothetical protein